MITKKEVEGWKIMARRALGCRGEQEELGTGYEHFLESKNSDFFQNN